MLKTAALIYIFVTDSSFPIELSKELPFYFIVRINGYFDKEAYFYDCFSYLLTIDNSSAKIIWLLSKYWFNDWV